MNEFLYYLYAVKHDLFYLKILAFKPSSTFPDQFFMIYNIQNRLIFYVNISKHQNSLWFTFSSKPMFLTFLCDFQRKGRRPKCTNSKACLSCILEFYLSLSICSASIAYTILCRGLKYLLKVPYIILDYPNVSRFLIFGTLFWAGPKHCSMPENNIAKMNSICVW